MQCARTDVGRRPAAGGGRSAGGGRQAKIAMSRNGHGLQGWTDGRAGTRHPVAEWHDGLFLLHVSIAQLFRA